jgi:hypothetical protein
LRDRDDVFRERLREGTFAPFSRASDKPIAIACLRLFTVRPELPLLRVPRFRRRIADSTVFEAFLPYFAMTSVSSQRIPTCHSMSFFDAGCLSRSFDANAAP